MMEASVGETLLLLKPPPSKTRPEMPKEELENFASRLLGERKEDISLIEMVSDGMNG